MKQTSVKLSVSAAMLTFGIAGTSYTPGVHAQQAASLDEIVVTARKRDETLQEVPIALSVFSGDQLDRAGFISLQDLSAFTPGLHFHDQGGQIPGRYNTAVRFRGMDTNQSAASQQLGTVFLDGIYVSQGISGMDFSNIERVEVIKGPQSATFGRSTFAGAVNYVTRTPSLTEYSGRVSAEMAQYGGRDVSLSYEGPLIQDTLGFRVSARAYGTDGQYFSIADGGDLGRERTQTIQATLFAQPTENFTARLRFFFSQDDDGPPAALFLGTQLSARATGIADAGANCFDVRPEEQAAGAVSNYYCGAIPRVNVQDFIGPTTGISMADQAAFAAPTFTPAVSGIEFPKIPGVPLVSSPGLKRNQQRWALSLGYDFDDGPLDGYSLTSLTGYSDMRASWVRDFDMTPVQNYLSQDPQRFEDFSQEVRLSSPEDARFRWSLGLSYFDAEFIRAGDGGMTIAGSDGGLCVVVQGVCEPGPIIGGNTDFPIEGGTTRAVFGSFAYDFLDNLTIDFEWRYQKDKITQEGRRAGAPSYEDEFTAFLPRATVSYRPTAATTVWGTYSRGNLPGFFNTDIAPLSAVELAAVEAQVGDVSFFNDEEKLTNYELGWRQQFGEGRFTVTAVAYQLDWTNLKTRQGVTILLDDGSERTLNLQFNAGDAEIRGLELEGSMLFTDRLSGSISFNMVSAEYGVLQCGFSPFQRPQTPGDTFGPRDCSGNTPARFPDRDGAVALTWVDQLGSSSWEYFIRGDATYFGKAYTEEANFAYIGKFWRFNLRGGFERDNLRIEGFVNNLFDDKNYLAGARWSDFSGTTSTGFLFSQGVILTPPTKRTIGLKAVYQF